MDVDCKNGNTYWTDDINLEMSNDVVAFEVLGAGVRAPPGWRKASEHIISDANMDFRRKNR